MNQQKRAESVWKNSLRKGNEKHPVDSNDDDFCCLQSIDLSRNYLTNMSAIDFASTLQEDENLCSLDLSFNIIYIEGIQALINAIAGPSAPNVAIQYLNLSNNEGTSKCHKLQLGN